MADISQQLDRAYNLIQENELQQARNILRPYTDADIDNPDVWWLYAHATEDPQAGRDALQRVLDLNPDYPGARELMQQLEMQNEPLFASNADDPFADDPFGEQPGSATAATNVVGGSTAGTPVRTTESAPATDEPRSRNMVQLLAVAIVALVIVGAILFLLSQNAASTIPSATEVRDLSSQVTDVAGGNDVLSPVGNDNADDSIGLVVTTDGTQVAIAGDNGNDNTGGTSFDSFSLTATQLNLDATSDAAILPTDAASDDNTGVVDPFSLTATQIVANATATRQAAANPGGASPTVVAVTGTAIPATGTAIDASSVNPTAAPVNTRTSASVNTGATASAADADAQAVEAVPDDVAERITDTLSAYDLPAGQVVAVQDTTLGRTLRVAICEEFAPTSQTALATVLETLANELDNVPGVDAVAMVYLDCNNQEQLAIVAAPASIAQAYADGDATERDFQGSWRAVE